MVLQLWRVRQRTKPLEIGSGLQGLPIVTRMNVLRRLPALFEGPQRIPCLAHLNVK
jgi:hypothetical protein